AAAAVARKRTTTGVGAGAAGVRGTGLRRVVEHRGTARSVRAEAAEDPRLETRGEGGLRLRPARQAEGDGQAADERGGGARGTAGGGPARRRAVVARRIGAVERARLRRAGQAVPRAAHAGAAPAHARGAAGADGAGADRFDAAGQVDLRVEREGQAVEGARAARDAAGTDARPVRDDIEDTGTGGGVGRVRDGEGCAEEAAGTRAVAHPE